MYASIIIIIVLISLGISLWGYYRIPDKEKNKREFAKGLLSHFSL